MEISLCKADASDAAFIHEMQVKAFMPLLEKYKDYETSPANESVEQIRDRINHSFADYYMIKSFDIVVGGVCILKKENKTYRVSIKEMGAG
ncbi:N-acetyltransferase [Paenibacillus sp. FSL R10-2791]|uniref:N-acetyltransferase n=1 Tax=Paenibacillus sp. FSL R10-2791 TaxID=2954695 RepID=UPI0030F7CA67